MLDIRKIKENPDAVKAGLKAKEVDCDAIVDRILELDVKIRSLKTERKQLEAAQKISALGLSVRQAELLCRNLIQEKEPELPKATLAIDYVAECEKSLSKILGRGVKIVNGKRKGKFELEFYGQDDLQNLLDALMKIQK